MAHASRPPLLAARVSPATKTRFVSLARQHGLSETALLVRLVDTVLEQNAGSFACHVVDESAESNERLSLRLRPGDRARIAARAAVRQMKPASYVTFLIRAHVRADPSMPVAELHALKLAVSQLSATHRCLDRIDRDAAVGISEELLSRLNSVSAHVDDVRGCVSSIVRGNLISWEAGDV